MSGDDRAMTTDPNSAVKAGTLLDEILGPHNASQTKSGCLFKAYLTFFKRFFFFFGCGPLFKSLLNLLQYSLFYVLVFQP